MWGYNNLTDLDIKDGTHFYHKMEGKVQAVLDSPSHVLSREQKEYWGSMADNVDTPLQYGYYGGWEIIINSFELLMFALLAVCIVVAPVCCIYTSYFCGVRAAACSVWDRRL